MRTPNIKTTRQVLPQIYAYTTPGVAYHEGWVKIGYTEMQSVSERIKQQSQTIAVKCQEKWSGNAVYESSTETFTDKAFHAYLERLGYEREAGTEWFKIDPEEAFCRFIHFRMSRGIYDQSSATTPYTLRESQEMAVQQTMKSFREYPGREFLWNAKPRFGKTLAVYDLCMRMGLQKVLVVTNRPAIADSWYSDYLKFVGRDRYCFVSRVPSLHNRLDRCMSRKEFVAQASQPGAVKSFIEFVSLQDLKGSIHFGGSYDKLEEVAEIKWDLLVIDEAHEGVDTFKTDVAFDQIQRHQTLHLSGTPFRALASDKFASDAIFNWTYVDECHAREEWDESKGFNPYEEMPRLNMYSYRMGDIVLEEVRDGMEIDGEQEAFAFDLNEFFRVEHGYFVHDEAVDKWLDALTTGERYPFSTPELRREMRHTFWLLDRVDSVRALARKLRAHPAFRDIEIVVAAGDGRTDSDDVIEDESSLERVRKAIEEHPDGTITLSVGQLTTGVTVPEWTGVLILSNLQSPAQYMQAAYRAQNPHFYIKAQNPHFYIKQSADGKKMEYWRKENAYIFDFDPARTLMIYEEMATGLSAETAHGAGDTDKRKEQIGELLNFFPVIGEDEEGQMVALDAEQVMVIPRQIRSKEVVRSGFMSNFLFANISNIYGGAPELLEIINKLTPVKAPTTSNLSDADIKALGVETDAEGNAKPTPLRVEQLQKALFGSKIYSTKSSVDEAVQEAVEQYSKGTEQAGKSREESLIDSIYSILSQKVLQVSDEQAKEAGTRKLSKRNKALASIQIRKEVHSEIRSDCSQASIDKKKLDVEYRKQSEGKTTQVQEQLHKETEDLKKAIDDALLDTIKQKSKSLLEESTRIVAEQHEVQRIEDKKRDTNELVRDHLRGFSRTIPSFLMAYGDETTTLASFDQIVPDEVFEELTSITLDQFRLLRDGGEILNEATGEMEEVKGHFFDEVVFDDSVREFMALRKRLANYFDPKVEADIFNYIPPQRTNQIFTPKRVVKHMVDLLEEENPGCFSDPHKTFADLYMKSGQYITEIVKRLYVGLEEQYPDREERLRHIFAEQVYGLTPTECIYRSCLRYILGFDEEIKIEKHNLRMADSLPAAKEGRMADFLDEIYPQEK